MVSLSLDEPEDEASVRKFLEGQKATFDNLIGESENALEEFGIAGGIPYFQLYDRNGQLRYGFSPLPQGDDELLEQIDVRVRELLSE